MAYNNNCFRSRKVEGEKRLLLYIIQDFHTVHPSFSRPDFRTKNQNVKHKTILEQTLHISQAPHAPHHSDASLFIIINNKTGSAVPSYPGVKYVVCTTYPGKQENQNITPTQIGACANIRCKHRRAREINKTGKQV